MCTRYEVSHSTRKSEREKKKHIVYAPNVEQWFTAATAVAYEAENGHDEKEKPSE